MQATDADEPSEGATESPGDCDGKSNGELRSYYNQRNISYSSML